MTPNIKVNRSTFTPVKGSNVNAGFKICPSSIVDEQLKKLTINLGFNWYPGTPQPSTQIIIVPLSQLIPLSGFGASRRAFVRCGGARAMSVEHGIAWGESNPYGEG